MSKPKFIKPLLIGCACAIPVGLVVGLSVNWDHRQFISSLGSSGVKPFIDAFGKQYTSEHPKIDVQVESGGTTFAIEQVAKGLTNVGNASNNPYYTINPETGTGYKDQWANKKTCTLGFEGLVILYKMPDGLSQEALDNFDIVISENNILDLYAVFSAFNESVVDGKVVAWKDLPAAKEQIEWRSSMLRYMTDESISHLTEKDKDIILKTPIIPFVRSGGNTAANSSIAFTYYSNLADFEEMTINQQNAYKGGQYGNDRLYYETEESNARAWEMFSKINAPGSMVYLTTGFICNEDNQKAIIDAGYRLAGYLPNALSEPVYFEHEGDLDKIATLSGYNWYRPINVMIDLDNQLSKDFISWIYSWDNEELKKQHCDLIRKTGAKPLTDEQYESMLKDGQLFSKEASDISLEEDRKESVFFDTVYGAEDIWR